MPTLFRIPASTVVLPGGGFLESDTRSDVRPAGRTRGEARRVRPQPRAAGSVA